MNMEKTYEVIVLAANCLLAAGVAADANDVDGVAVQSNGDVKSLKVDREQAQEA